MPFPATEQKIFEKNTLTGVTYQLDYPPILKIALETPSAFQEAVRGDYPLFRVNPTVRMTMQVVGGQAATSSVTNSYIFSTPETPQPQRTLTLAQDSLALTTTAYTRRSELLAQLQPALDALQTVYKPAFFTRVGLRYQNLIVRSSLGLADRSWGELLKPIFVGLASADELAGRVSIDYSQIQFRGKVGSVVVQHGTAITATAGKHEECYLIDMDVSTNERVNKEDATEKLRELNIDALEFYHWCLSDTLKAALVPRNIS
jgi:uncharacterized protein (TIGR04255 family)